MEAIKGSLSRFGQAEPLVVQKSTGVVIGGNGRLVAMKELGWTECDVVQLDVDGLDATALGIALNRSSDLAESNPIVLAKLLDELRAEDSLDGVGYSGDDIDSLLEEIQAGIDLEQDVEQDEVPAPPEIATTRTCDLWLLGDHRLLCGDSTSLEDVRRVMDGDQAAIGSFDPPYLVDYTGERPNDSGKDWSGSYKEIDIKDADGFFRCVFANVLEVLAPNAAIYCWHAHKRQGAISKIWEDLGILDHQQIVWVKPAPVFGRVYWHFQHEPCMMGWRKGSKPEHNGKHEFTSVWQIDYDGQGRRAGEHPTQKPLEIFARPLLKHTRKGDICFEPFSGSGSQIIAAEQLGRCCRALEIEPVFVDLAITRWQNLTGQAAILEGTKKTFEEVRRERAE